MSNKRCSLLMLINILLTCNVCAADVDFTISNIKKSEGKIYVQLFKGKENYKKGNAINTSIMTPVGDTSVATFSNLATGEYAIRYFYDQNNNGKMDMNLMGAPQEGYGFSNSAKPSYGPVKFEHAKFTVHKQRVINRSSVIYGE